MPHPQRRSAGRSRPAPRARPADWAVLYLEVADAARALGISGGGVKLLELRGELPRAATTPRGTRLYSPEAVAALRGARAHARRR